MKALALALSKAQSEFPDIPKNCTVNYGNTKFKYADLSTIISATRPALAKHELSYVQLVELGNLKTILMHSSGESIEANCPIPSNLNKMQDLGSALTYARRYSLQSILGVSADDDIDGQDENGAGVSLKQAKTKEDPKKASPIQDLSPDQKYRDGLMKALSNIIKNHNIQKVVLEKYVLELTGSNKASKDLSNEELEALILKLEASFEGGV